MADRPTAMDILTAHRKADVDALADMAQGLLTSLAVADVKIQELRADQEERRKGQRERTRKSRLSRAVTLPDVTERDSPVSPHTPHLPPTSTSSSSARVLSWRPADETALAGRLPSEQGRVALAAVLFRCDDKRAVAAEIGMILDGGRPGVSNKPAHMELALSDYASNGLTDGKFNAVHFRRHVQRAAKPEQSNGRRHRGGVGPEATTNAMEVTRMIDKQLFAEGMGRLAGTFRHDVDAPVIGFYYNLISPAPHERASGHGPSKSPPPLSASGRVPP
jgi:hypothetical protein